MSEAGFRKVANKKDLKEGGLLGIELDGNRIVLAMVGGKVYAMDAVCSYEGGPLDQGELEGNNLTCPWHHAVFDVRNGNVSETTVWAMDQKSFPVKVDESTDDILVNTSRATTELALAIQHLLFIIALTRMWSTWYPWYTTLNVVCC